MMQVDLTQCIACKVCEETCPVGAVSMQKPLELLEPRIPACTKACPVGTNVPMYIDRIREKDEAGAYDIITERNPFPSVCGRVCHRPCEAACRRGRFDEALAIRELKRFASEKFTLKKSGVPLKNVEVAIIGAGPAGLAAAWALVRQGYRPTIYEREKKAGGWMYYGIPDYRLPKRILEKEIQAILSMGVKVRYGEALGKAVALDSLRKSGAKAVFIAVGSQISQRLNLPGQDLDGVVQGLDFLRAFHRGIPMEVKGEVAVVGGGNVAFDAARVALRLGASKVTILYRRGIEQMPADKEEIEAAQDEGIRIRCLSNPIEFRGRQGRVHEIVCEKMILGEPDASGRPRPIPVKDSIFSFSVDQVICSVGQKTDFDFFEEDQAKIFNLQILETGIPGVFVAGDMVKGPASVIEAIASGQTAAVSMIQYLNGENITGQFIPTPSNEARVPYGVYEYPLRIQRAPASLLPPSRRTKTFDEVNTGYSKSKAVREGNRCWHCNRINDYPSFNEKCVECNLCSLSCTTKAIPFGKEIIENSVKCDNCPVGCQIKEGFLGACQRYTNVSGRLETVAPLRFPERETVEEMWRNYVLQTPLVLGVCAGTAYPDYKPANVQAEDRIDGIDVVTVVTEAPLTYSSVLVKIDTAKSIGEEGAPVKLKNRVVGHVTTEQYGSKMLSLGGVNLMKTDYKPMLTRLLVDIANKEPFSLEVEGGSKLQLQVGQVPVIDDKPAERMKICCGAAMMGMFGDRLKGLADEIIVLDPDITGIFSQGHGAQFQGYKDTGIRPPGVFSMPGRYFGTPGNGWGGTNIQDPREAIFEYDKKKIWPGMKVLVLEVTGQKVAMLEADDRGEFHETEVPREAQEMRELIATNSEPALTSAVYMGGSGGSARAGTTKNPIKLNQAVHSGRVKVTIGGVPAFILPGGGINFMVDVGKMKWRSFTWVAAPAIVSPVEYTMEKKTFIEMGGHLQALRLLGEIQATEEAKWKTLGDTIRKAKGRMG